MTKKLHFNPNFITKLNQLSMRYKNISYNNVLAGISKNFVYAPSALIDTNYYQMVSHLFNLSLLYYFIEFVMR